MIRINLWSGPRNISTAMMYSFEQRNDAQVVDEPLYAHYLYVSRAPHPGREEVLASQENDGRKVIEKILSDDWKMPVVFFKQMTHHLVNLPLDFLSQTKNILLIRNPKDVLISYSKVIENPVLFDIGIKQSYDLWRFLEAKNFHRIIVDANEVLKNPEAMLMKLCKNLGIEFQSAMLHWEAGARKEDGVWAKYWYQNVHQSTGFAPFEKEEKKLPERMMKIYEKAKPFYDFLFEKSLKAY
ncbi:MAG: hypothetical protein ACHQD9_05655 [Chitinophagales bacterium]